MMGFCSLKFVRQLHLGILAVFGRSSRFVMAPCRSQACCTEPEIIRFGFLHLQEPETHLIEVFCNLTLEYPEATREAIMQNWLVNLAGMPRRFHELNLMQEHFNLWLEELAQHKGNEFGDTWYRDTLSMHVYNFLRLTDEMENHTELAA